MKPWYRIASAISAIFLIGCTGSFSLKPIWTAHGEFISPESAVYDSKHQWVYVSNVNGYTTNGLGYLSKLDKNGQVITTKWIDQGLNAPTGMSIDQDMLYVADFDRLVQIDTSTGEIRATYPAPNDNPGLNDVSISPDGQVFVTASNIQTIYVLEDNALRPWLSSDALQFANGIWAGDEEILVAAFHLHRIDRNSREISEPLGLESGLEDLESVEPDGQGGFFITLIGNKPIMSMDSQGKIRPLLDREVFSADVEYIPDSRMLIVPSGGDQVTAFEFSQ